VASRQRTNQPQLFKDGRHPIEHGQLRLHVQSDVSQQGESSLMRDPIPKGGPRLEDYPVLFPLLKERTQPPRGGLRPCLHDAGYLRVQSPAADVLDDNVGGNASLGLVQPLVLLMDTCHDTPGETVKVHGHWCGGIHLVAEGTVS
jgi:hypothetical protein